MDTGFPKRSCAGFKPAGVTRSFLSQSRECTSRIGRSTDKLMPKAARERIASPRAGAAYHPTFSDRIRNAPCTERVTLGYIFSDESQWKRDGAIRAS